MTGTGGRSSRRRWAAACSSWATTSSAPTWTCWSGASTRRRQRDPDQGEPDRHAHGDLAVHRTGALQRLRRGDLAPLRRDGGHVHRRPRRRVRGGTDQDGERVAHRPGGEVQSATGDRRGAGRRGVLPRQGAVRAMSRLELAGIVGAIVLLALAFQGGEYGTLDWLQLRRQLAEERAAVRAGGGEVASLRRAARALG